MQPCPSSKRFQPQSFGATLRLWPLKVCRVTNFGKEYYCSSLHQAEDTSKTFKSCIFYTSTLSCMLACYSSPKITFSQSSWRLPCHICRNSSFQDNCHVHNFPDNLFADMFRSHLGSNCGRYVSFDDHAFGSSKTILSSQVFQRSTPSRFGCSRVWRSTSFAIQSRNSKIPCPT